MPYPGRYLTGRSGDVGGITFRRVVRVTSTATPTPAEPRDHGHEHERWRERDESNGSGSVPFRSVA